MKPISYLFSFFILLAFSVSARQEVIKSSPDTLGRADQVLLHNSVMLSAFDSRTTETQPNFYLDPAWTPATVIFYPRTIGTSKGTIKLDSVSDVLIRILLKGNDVEFSTQEGIKAISGSLVRSFTIRKSDLLFKKYINTYEFTDNSELVKSGFFEILSDGKIKLLEYAKLKVNQRDHTQGFNTSNTYIMTDTERLLFITKGKEVVKFNTGKKDLYVLMADKKTEIEKFIKDNKLSLKSRADLARIFDYYSEL